MPEVYPSTAADRDRWILSRRPGRHAVDPQKPFAYLLEEECSESGEIVQVATIFLTNRECPWHCLMCDLWKNTLTEAVPLGAIPVQIDYALEHVAAGILPASEGGFQPPGSGPAPSVGRDVGSIAHCQAGSLPPRQIKLYNSGSFFDPRAIPPEDYPAIADRVGRFERVIVECHPSLVGDRCLEFRDLLSRKKAKSGSSRREEALTEIRNRKLEVAMGLETAHPEVLEKLNKRMTLGQFSKAADFLRRNDIALRAFVLIKPPFLVEAEALHWAKRSIDFAFDCGATVVSLIPTRPGNGALEALVATGEFSPPKLATLEAATEYGIALKRGRVFADLWDLEKFSECRKCFPKRLERLRQMNHEQLVRPDVMCAACGSHS